MRWWNQQPNQTLNNLISLLWGLCEATFFFLIPDIYLTRIALSNNKQAIIACLYATVGALIGGMIMYFWGMYSPVSAQHFLLTIPAISPTILEQVTDSLNTPLQSLMTAPFYGIPYKIYAVELGRAKTPILYFLLTSFAARICRFVLTVTLTTAAVKLFRRQSEKFYYLTHLIVWTLIYSYYFYQFGF